MPLELANQQIGCQASNKYNKYSAADYGAQPSELLFKKELHILHRMF